MCVYRKAKKNERAEENWSVKSLLQGSKGREGQGEPSQENKGSS